MTDTVEHTKTRTDASFATLILKGSNTSTTDRDAGFCSGGDEDDLEIEDDIHSPTDASEDSVEVKVTPISCRNKNKRKCAEPRKVPNEEVPTGPLKKRIRFEMKKELAAEGTSPFRPWSVPSRPINSSSTSPSPDNFHPVYGYQQLPPSSYQQDEPLSLVKTKQESPEKQRRRIEDCSATDIPVPDNNLIIRPKEFTKVSSIKTESPRVPPHPAVRPLTATEIEDQSRSSNTTPGFSVESLLSPKLAAGSSKMEKLRDHKEPKEQRNYKNMTRERRIEANARERTRVHTISAAFDTLRRAIPAYSHNQKLSKLSVLRIACSYILTLSRVAGTDYSADQSAPSLASCVDLVSRTIQTEGKLRKKKDE